MSQKRAPGITMCAAVHVQRGASLSPGVSILFTRPAELVLQLYVLVCRFFAYFALCAPRDCAAAAERLEVFASRVFVSDGLWGWNGSIRLCRMWFKSLVSLGFGGFRGIWGMRLLQPMG